MNLWNIPGVPHKGWKNFAIIDLSGDSIIFWHISYRLGHVRQSFIFRAVNR